MLFKKKVTVPDYCSGKLTRLFSQERETTWEGLRARCNDARLNQAERTLYHDNLRAVMIELMQIAVTKNCRWTSSISFDTRSFVETYLHKRGLGGIASLIGEYNQAFGSSTTDGVEEIVALFAEKVTGSKMGELTKRQFYEEFYAILAVLFKEFECIKLVSAGGVERAVDQLSRGDATMKEFLEDPAVKDVLTSMTPRGEREGFHQVLVKAAEQADRERAWHANRTCFACRKQGVADYMWDPDRGVLQRFCSDCYRELLEDRTGGMEHDERKLRAICCGCLREPGLFVASEQLRYCVKCFEKRNCVVAEYYDEVSQRWHRLNPGITLSEATQLRYHAPTGENQSDLTRAKRTCCNCLEEGVAKYEVGDQHVSSLYCPECYEKYVKRYGTPPRHKVRAL